MTLGIAAISAASAAAIFACKRDGNAVDATLVEWYGRFAHDPDAAGAAEGMERLHAAAEARRAQLLSGAWQAASSRPKKYGTILPPISRSLAEKRLMADERQKTVDELVRQLPRAVTRHRQFPKQTAVRCVLAVILNLCALDRGQSDASISTIAQKARCSRSTVNQSLAILRETGWIVIRSGRKRGVVNIIRVAQANLAERVTALRARLHAWLDRAEKASDQFSLAFFSGGGVQKFDQKIDSQTKHTKITSGCGLQSRSRALEKGLAPPVLALG